MHLFHEWKSWYVEPGAHVLVVTLVERSTLYERQVLRFQSGEDRSHLAVVPERAWLSPDGSVLAFQVATGQGGSGPDVGLVNVHAEAAIMLRYAAQSASAARNEKATNDWAARRAARIKVSVISATAGLSKRVLSDDEGAR